MAKYGTEFKMRIVKEYLKGNISFKNLAKKYNISHHEIVKRWVNAYKSQGYEGLKVKRQNTQYTLEFKLNVVNLYLTGEMSYQSLANELKMNNPSKNKQFRKRIINTSTTKRKNKEIRRKKLLAPTRK